MFVASVSLCVLRCQKGLTDENYNEAKITTRSSFSNTMSHKIFVYGTLMSEKVLNALLGRVPPMKTGFCHLDQIDD